MPDVETKPQMSKPVPHHLPDNLENQPKYSLEQFVLNGSANVMKQKMLDDKYILGQLALLGQGTVFYAKPNSGKTLLTIWLITEAIKKGELNGRDVFYVNADDTYKGLVFKLELAERYGFNMLAPGHNGFEAKHFTGILNELISTQQASGKIIILDTLKKFTDLMKKDKSSQFAEIVRQFISHGGSVIMLAHTNKHRDMENNLIPAGTSDIIDDMDCAYVIDEISNSGGVKVVEFANIKNRGDVVERISYEYKSGPDVKYTDKLDSVRALEDEEIKRAREVRKINEQLEKDSEIVESIIQIIHQQPNILKTDLVRLVHEDIGTTKDRVRKILNRYDGDDQNKEHKWQSQRGEKNAQTYELNWWVSIDQNRKAT